MPRSDPSAADLDLIDRCKEAGCEVSSRQLERWRTADLLARNVRLGLGRGRGTRAVQQADLLEPACFLSRHARRGVPLQRVGIAMYVGDVDLPEAGLRRSLTWLASHLAHVGSVPEGDGVDEDGLPVTLGWAEDVARQWMTSPDPSRRTRRARLRAVAGEESVASVEQSVMTAIIHAMATGEVPLPETLREVSAFFGFDELPDPLRPDSATALLEESFAEAEGRRLLAVARECPSERLYAARDSALALAEIMPILAEQLESEFGKAAVLEDILASPIRRDDRALAAQALLIASHQWTGPEDGAEAGSS